MDVSKYGELVICCRHPNTACEVLTADVYAIIDKLTNNEVGLLKKRSKFIYTGEETVNLIDDAVICGGSCVCQVLLLHSCSKKIVKPCKTSLKCRRWKSED